MSSIMNISGKNSKKKDDGNYLVCYAVLHEEDYYQLGDHDIDSDIVEVYDNYDEASKFIMERYLDGITKFQNNGFIDRGDYAIKAEFHGNKIKLLKVDRCDRWVECYRIKELVIRLPKD